MSPGAVQGTALSLDDPVREASTVARDVRTDQREAFEGWGAEVLALAARFPGNLGTSLLRPGPGSTLCHLVYRVADGESLARWERSTERQAALARAEHLTGRVDHAHVAGLDGFFTALTPSRPGPRWRPAVVTVAAVYAITLAFQLLVAPHVSGWPLAARLLLSAVIVVVLLGHVVMPALSRLFRRWLHPARD